MISAIKHCRLYKTIISRRDEQITHSLFLQEYGDQLKQFKDCHKGERCFIIGNGPSLRPSDLDLLANEVTFASNYIFKIYSQTKWRPTYYCNSDLGVLQKIKNDPLFWNNEAKYNFFQYNARFVLDNRFPPQSVCLYLKESQQTYTPFSSRIDKIVHDSATITYIMLQIACYMGFSQIYLLGIDHNYSITIDDTGVVRKQTLRDHFYSLNTGKDEDGGGVAFVKKMERGYFAARKYAKKHNIIIQNATRGGKLEVFERKNLDDLF